MPEKKFESMLGGGHPNALKHICRAEPELLVNYLDHLLERVAQFDQASTQWAEQD